MVMIFLFLCVFQAIFQAEDRHSHIMCDRPLELFHVPFSTFNQTNKTIRGEAPNCLPPCDTL